MQNKDFLNKVKDQASSSDYDKSLQDLLEDNIRYSKAIYEDTQKIRRHMLIRTIINIVWVVLVVAPLVFALFYLPPVFRQFFQAYRDILGQTEGTFDLIDQLNQVK